LQVVDQRIFALEDKLSAEDSRKRGEELGPKAFGTLTGFLMGVKKGDIDVTYVEKRYEPFWHILCTTHWNTTGSGNMRSLWMPQSGTSS